MSWWQIITLVVAVTVCTLALLGAALVYAVGEMKGEKK